ncbi:MAG: HEAT repeat domain-containing protein [Bdellovibrionota bacterium]
MTRNIFTLLGVGVMYLAGFSPCMGQTLVLGTEIPNSYKERQIRFDRLINKGKLDSDKLKIVQKEASNARSEFQVDAIIYLGRHPDVSSVPVLLKAGENQDVVSFVCHSLGEIGGKDAFVYLMSGLSHENENDRGTCYAALALYLPDDFKWKFNYYGSPKDRAASMAQLDDWWNKNQDRNELFQKVEKTPLQEQKASQQWDEIGQDYLNR